MHNSELECSGTWTWQDGDELIVEDRADGIMFAVNSTKSNVAFMAVDAEVFIGQVLGVLLGRHSSDATLAQIAREHDCWPICCWCDADLTPDQFEAGDCGCCDER